MVQGNQISFILNDKLVQLELFDKLGRTPITTVLNYLRSLPGYTGCKEGCAEGDCGACTVVIGTLSEDKIQYKAIDACLVFLPMLHGKQLISVEHVGNLESLHPVQTAMIETDGSQCGYCTPGFIMSLLALYKNHNNPSKEAIEDALSGNLCRCTGYRSIAQAAAIACTNTGKDHFTDQEKNISSLLKEIDDSYLSIEAGQYSYHRPTTLIDAIRLKSEHPDMLIINGATDVALRVTKLKQDIPSILDLSNILELKEYVQSGNSIIIGAGASLQNVNTLSENKLPALHKMLTVFGSKQIRELATMGGNIGSASPIGDLPPVLMAYNAKLTLVGVKGEREIPMKEFITGYRQTQIEGDEIIKSITIPVPPDNTKISSYKISKRKGLDISTVSGGFSLKLNSNGIVEDICLAYGGMAERTKRADLAEHFLIGKAWNRENIEAAMERIDNNFQPISDARANAEGRTVMARNLLMKFWIDTKPP